MIDEWLTHSWAEEPPQEMNFTSSFSDLLNNIEELMVSEMNMETALQLYIKSPLIVSAIIDNQIEGKITDQGVITHGIQLLKDIYTGQTDEVLGSLDYFKINCPERTIVSKADKYSWLGSDPEALKELKSKIDQSDFKPEVIVGSAHGAIRPGILLSLMLDTEIYFVRYSKFKIQDSKPQATEIDQHHLDSHIDRNILVYDEDAPTGKTLQQLAAFLFDFYDYFGIADPIKTATSLAYRGNVEMSKWTTNKVHVPDFVGHFFD